MHYYIAEWVETTDEAGTVFRPPIDEAGDWSLIDLRPDPSVVDGYCFIASDHDHGSAPGLWYLTDDLDAALPPPTLNYIQNGLGITLAENTFRGAVAEVMLVHAREDGTRWKAVKARNGLVEIYLRGLVYEAPEIVGIAVTESFNTSNSDTLGPDLTWTEITGDMDIESNLARLGATGVAYARAANAASTDDQYASLDVETLNPGAPGAGQIGVQARTDDASSNAYMFYSQEHSTAASDGYKLRKTVATNSRTDLTSLTNESIPGLPFELKLTVVGSTLKGYWDDTQKDTVTDTTYSGSTYRRGSIYMFIPGSGSSPYVRVDNFAFGDISTGTGFGGWGILPAS